MKFGLFFLAEQAPGVSASEVMKNTLEQCRVADELGYDVLWLTEHHFAPYGLMVDSLMFGAAVSQVTKHAKIGQGVVVTPFHNPIRLAEQVAMLDILSDGRCYFGVGRGYQQREFRGFGIDQNTATARFRESMDIVEGLLTNESFTYEGQFWNIDNVRLEPKTLSGKMPPTFVAVVTTPESFDWAIAKNYDILGGNPYGLDPKTGHSRQAYIDALARAGRSTKALDRFWGMTSDFFLHDDSQRAKDLYHPSWSFGNQLVSQFGDVFKAGDVVPKGFEAYQVRGSNYSKAGPPDYEAALQSPGALVGSPDEVVEKIHKGFEQLPMNNYIMWTNRGGGVPQKDILHSLELFAEKVMPQVRHLEIDSAHLV